MSICSGKWWKKLTPHHWRTSRSYGECRPRGRCRPLNELGVRYTTVGEGRIVTEQFARGRSFGPNQPAGNADLGEAPRPGR